MEVPENSLMTTVLSVTPHQINQLKQLLITASFTVTDVSAYNILCYRLEKKKAS